LVPGGSVLEPENPRKGREVAKLLRNSALLGGGRKPATEGTAVNQRGGESYVKIVWLPKQDANTKCEMEKTGEEGFSWMLTGGGISDGVEQPGSAPDREIAPQDPDLPVTSTPDANPVVSRIHSLPAAYEK
jgi:hypothetical protein